MSYYGPGVTDPTGLSQVLRGPAETIRVPDPAPKAAGRVGAMARRGGGWLLLGLCTAAAFSLLTWSVTDPSLTHAASGGVRNWMGPLGAIVSDLMVQMLGLASMIAVLPPAYWAVQLMDDGRLSHSKTKIVFAPLAVVGLALAFSALPMIAAWPLKHGYGGMMGDLAYGRLVGLLSMINASRAGAAAGIFGLAVGLLGLQRSLGLTKGEFRALFNGRGDAGAVGLGGAKHWFSKGAHTQVMPAAAERQVPSNAPGQPVHTAAMPVQAAVQTLPAAEFGARPITQAPVQQPTPYRYQPAPYPQGAPHPGYKPPIPYHAPQPRPMMAQPPGAPGWPQAYPLRPQPVYQPMPMRQAPHAYAPAPMQPQHHMPAPTPPMPAQVVQPKEQEPAGTETRTSEIGFDRDTDHESRKIAERFAPMRLSIGDPAPAAAAVDEVIEPEIVMPSLRVDASSRAVTVAPGGFFERLTGGMRRHAPLTQHYKRPSLNLLKRATLATRGDPAADREVLRERSRLLLETLGDFGVKGEITAVRPGPVVTLFEFEPARGTKSSRVIGLADDIARSMSARAVRIAVVPGVNAIGIELPNAERESVGLRELLESDLFRKSEAKLPLALGKGIGGNPIIADLARMPHLLVAGTTGAGKSVGVNAMILSLLYQLPPDECRLILIDPKMLELSVYNGIPHLLTPVVTDPNKAVAALNWAVGEMESRYKRMSALSVRNIEVYNNRVRNAKKRDDLHGGQGTSLPAAVAEVDLSPMAHIVVVVDEFADLMAVAGKEIEFAVQRLAQMARAAGIHLIMATQRPSVDIITGTIKANFPTRISFRVTSRIDSRTILNEQGAEQLLGQGDMLYASGTGQVLRVHGPFVSDEEVEAIAAYLRTLGAPDYVDGITDVPDADAPQKAAEVLDEDDLYDRAVALVRNDLKASTSYLQRRLGIGYNRAADLIERMEQDGIVGPANAAGKRELRTSQADAGAEPDAG